jgi:hypothetical protein
VPAASPNFAYLAYHDARPVALATQAEHHFKYLEHLSGSLLEEYEESALV